MSDAMRCGVILPGGTAAQQLELGLLAEEHGWDGVFVCEVAYGVDAWSLLAGMAVRTSRIRLGTLLSPLPWRRPWKLAGQVATVDQLSGGRAIVTVGLGATEMLMGTAEVTDRRERAERMDEGIDLMRMLWSGERAYSGKYYEFGAGGVGDFADMGLPVQRPVPIWVVGAWPRPRSMRRAARCEGVVPEYHLDGREPTASDAREMKTWLLDHGRVRTSTSSRRARLRRMTRLLRVSRWRRVRTPGVRGGWRRVGNGPGTRLCGLMRCVSGFLLGRRG
jgi:alkanesulfonate monooxygenase SsuD/methylene tetrahydromethanopterin reductase-like flavin-dependent oxidoreductase (luciferase family)